MLSEKDQHLICDYRKAQVLEDLDGHRLDPRSGLIIVSCGDPDQFPEMYDYKCTNIVQAGCCRRFSAPSPLGGALRLVPDSPTNLETPGYDQNILWDMKYINRKKDISTVALYVHAPCAMATHVNMNFQEILANAFCAKSRIKTEMPGVRVAVFCHIDYGDGRKKSYFVSKTRWAEFHRSTMHRLRLMYPDRVTIIPAQVHASPSI